MVLVACPACDHRISEKAVACPSCGHPGAPDRSGAVRALGRVAGTYISARTLAEVVLGSVLFLSTAAVLIALILSQR